MLPNTEIGYDLKISAGAKGDNYITTNEAADAVVTGKVLGIEVASEKSKKMALLASAVKKRCQLQCLLLLTLKLVL